MTRNNFLFLFFSVPQSLFLLSPFLGAWEKKTKKTDKTSISFPPLIQTFPHDHILNLDFYVCFFFLNLQSFFLPFTLDLFLPHCSDACFYQLESFFIFKPSFFSLLFGAKTNHFSRKKNSLFCLNMDVYIYMRIYVYIFSFFLLTGHFLFLWLKKKNSLYTLPFSKTLP